MTSFLELPDDLPRRLSKQTQTGTRREALKSKSAGERLIAAAVLMPLIRLEGQWHLVYTLRSSLLHDHSGQVSFPGGSRESQDKDLIETALREAWEEIGLNPSAVKVLGRMANLEMVTRFTVTPVVGVCDWPTELTINPDEVDRVFSIPLDWLADENNRYYRVHTHHGSEVEVVYFKPYDGETVWGATAMMTVEFLNLLNS